MLFLSHASHYRLLAVMKAAKSSGLHVVSEVFSGETHSTACPIAFAHGVQVVFGKRRASNGVY